LRLSASEIWARARTLVGDDLWSIEIQPRGAVGRVQRFLQFAVMIGEGFVRDRLMLRASALSYFTILSLIPLVAVAVALVGSFGVSENLARMVVEVVAAGSPEAQQQIVELIEGANFGGLGTLGVAALFLTTVLGISNVEKALNSIWGVRQQRTWVRRLPDYLAVLVVAPLMLATALSLAGTLESQWLVQRMLAVPAFSVLYEFGLTYAPLIVLSLAFAFVYWFLPNTSVRVSSALLGGLVAGSLGVLAQKLYLDFSIGVAKYNALFGGFAALPLLFVWIYIFCAIVLLGAEVAFAHQNLELYRREVRGGRADPAQCEAIGMRLALEVARAFRDARPAWTADALADSLRVPVRTVRQVLFQLETAGIIASRGEAEKEGGFQLARPAERIQVTQVLGALRGSRESIAGDAALAEATERLLTEVEEGAAKGAAEQTLADAIAGMPASDSPA
jgi:membrane protein